METAYEAARAASEAHETAWRDYEVARNAWLRNGGIPTEGQPLHACSISVPGRDDFIWFEEFDSGGISCGGMIGDGRYGLGSARAVLAGLTRRPADDPWLDAVVGALERERVWTYGRRNSLDVHQATGQLYHVSAAANRESILRHGLDWRLMTRPGVAGSTEPELDGIYLCENESDVRFFTDMSRVPTDIWAVDVSGRWVESGPSGWVFVVEPIPADAVLLVRHDVTSTKPGKWT